MAEQSLLPTPTKYEKALIMNRQTEWKLGNVLTPLNTSSTWNLYFMVFRVMGCWSESWGEGSKKLRLFLKTLEGSRMSRGRILIAGAADRVNTLSARPLNAIKGIVKMHN